MKIRYNLNQYQIKRSPIITDQSVNSYQQFQQLFSKMQKEAPLLWKKVQIGNGQVNQPSPRWGHTCCIIDQQIVFFGGYADSKYMNDIWVFNSSTLLWTQITATGDIPEKRSNCTMNYDSEKQRIIIFGGGGSNKKRFSSIHALDWNSKVWSQIKPKQDSRNPIQRTYHTSQLKSNYLIIFGGEAHWDLDDLWIFDFSKLTWTQIVIQDQNKPPARRFHSSVLLENQMYIIGGCYDRYRSLNNIYSLDLTDLINTGDYSTLRWKQRQFEGASFLTRWGHTSSVFDGKIYIFAGRFSNDLNDLLVYDPQIQTVKNMIRNLKQAPSARRRHCATFVGSSLVVFGGFNGQYFNDLHYINLQNSNQSWVMKSMILKTIDKSIDDQRLSDVCVKCSDGNTLHFSLQMLGKGFQDARKIPMFIKQLKKHSKNECLKLLRFIYSGQGQISQDAYYQYTLKGYRKQKPQIRTYYQSLTKCLRKYQLSSIEFLSSHRQQSGIIQLTFEEWMNAFDILQSGMHLDFEFQFEQEIIRCPSILLKLNSMYFQNLLQFQETAKTRFMAPNNYFRYVLLFILTDYLLIPKKLTHLQLIELIKLSRFYHLERLVSICEFQLLQIGFDSEHILKVAIQHNLPNLKHYCAEQQIRKEFLLGKNSENIQFSDYDLEQKKPKLTRLQSQVVECKRKAFQNCFFDIQQTKALKNKFQERDLKKSISCNIEECEKQNSQMNY